MSIVLGGHLAFDDVPGCTNTEKLFDPLAPFASRFALAEESGTEISFSE